MHAVQFVCGKCPDSCYLSAATSLPKITRHYSILQVIRRGDRRPFYAPAKYVVELRPEDVPASEMMAASAGGHPNLNFSTFGPLKGKRSSYAPASGSSGVMLIPPPATSLESTGRLNDRYFKK